MKLPSQTLKQILVNSGYVSANDFDEAVGISNDSDREAVLGVRVPIGVSYQFPYTFLEVFGELVPAMQIIEETRGRFHCGVGILIWL